MLLALFGQGVTLGGLEESFVLLIVSFFEVPVCGVFEVALCGTFWRFPFVGFF